MPTKKTLADHAFDLMQEQGEVRIYARMLNLCHDIYDRSGGSRSHPQNKLKSVIDAVRRDSRFYQVGYLRAIDATGRREVLHPVFAIKPDRLPIKHPTGGCPKCGASSGDSWAQCEGSCPMPMSPHYNIAAASEYPR